MGEELDLVGEALGALLVVAEERGGILSSMPPMPRVIVALDRRRLGRRASGAVDEIGKPQAEQGGARSAIARRLKPTEAGLALALVGSGSGHLRQLTRMSESG